MTFLPDLCQFQHHVVAAESCPNRQVLKVKPADYQILTKGAIRYFSTAVPEILNLFIAEKAYLTVPFSGVRIFLYAKIFNKFSLLNVFF